MVRSFRQSVPPELLSLSDLSALPLRDPFPESQSVAFPYGPRCVAQCITAAGRVSVRTVNPAGPRFGPWSGSQINQDVLRESCVGFYSRCVQRCAVKIRWSSSSRCIAQIFRNLDRLLHALAVCMCAEPLPNDRRADGSSFLSLRGALTRLVSTRNMRCLAGVVDTCEVFIAAGIWNRTQHLGQVAPARQDRHRHGPDPRREHTPSCRSTPWCRCALLGADRGAVRLEP